MNLTKPSPIRSNWHFRDQKAVLFSVFPDCEVALRLWLGALGLAGGAPTRQKLATN